MRSGVNSAFWAALQLDHVPLCELFEITHATGTYRYTTANHPLVSSGNVYTPFPGASGDGVEESTDLGIGNVGFALANSGTLPGELTNAHAMRHTRMVAYRVFTNSPDLGRLYYFDGTIGDYVVNRAQVRGEIRAIPSQGWPYYTYQDNCVWKFGGFGCGINTSSFTVAGSLNVASSTRFVIRAAAGTLANSFGPDTLQFGRVTITSGVNSGQRRAIFSNTGDLITLSHVLPFSHEAAGVTFSFHRGCRKRLVADCTSLFNNTSAFLGFPHTPKEAF